MAFDLNKIKSLFVVVDEAPKKEETTPKQEEKKTTDTPKQVVNQKENSSLRVENIPEEIKSEGTAKINQLIFDNLTTAISKANLPGEDYLEFVDALRAMKDIPLTDELKMQTVFATLSTKGLTVPKILESADYYTKILENEKAKFYEVLKQQTHGQVNQKANEVNVLENDNKRLADEIARLTEKISQNQAKMEQLKKDMSGNEEKIKSTETDFLYTYDLVANQIKNNVEKIKSIKS